MLLRGRRNLVLLYTAVVLGSIATLIYLNHNAVGDRLRGPWLWALGYTRYDFKPTADEAACYDGSITPHSSPGLTTEIPRTVHFVWGTKALDGRGGKWPFSFYLSIRAAIVTLGLSRDEVRVHYTYLDREGEWFKRLEEKVTLVHHTAESYMGPYLDKGAPEDWNVAHLADVLRLHVIAQEGGTYLDSDAYVLRPLDVLRQGHRDVVMGHEGGMRRGLTNAVILAKQGAPFIRRWLDMYTAFDEKDWNYHSVILPRELEKKYPDEVCAVAPSVFFWPMWTDEAGAWTHGALTDTEAAEVEEQVRMYRGSLFEDQLVLHAWGTKGHEALSRLTPERIRTENTRFNILARRFLEDK